MGNLFQARRNYRMEADGYRLDGYMVAESIDGYQISERFVSLSEAAHLGRLLQKVDHMLSHTGTIFPKAPAKLELQNVPSGMVSPRIPVQIADRLKELYAKMAEQARARDKEHHEHLVALRATCASTQAAIRHATDDGYAGAQKE